MWCIYASYIGDGYADAEEPTEYDAGNMSEEGAYYWMSLRHAEVGCPCTDDQSGRDGCPLCGGSGLMEGEPFTVSRLDFRSEEDARACWDQVQDAGDGYERASVLARWANDGKTGSEDVLEWEPDMDAYHAWRNRVADPDATDPDIDYAGAAEDALFWRR